MSDMSTDLELYCWIEGDHPNNAFFITISAGRKVYDLKLDIYKSQEARFKRQNVYALDLQLWKVDFPHKSKFEDAKRVLEDENALFSHEVLSKHFSPNLHDTNIHIVVRAHTYATKRELKASKFYTRLTVDQMAATEKSWVRPFKGDGAKGLWEHIKKCYSPFAPTVYAHYTVIVQSSGMGKSRTMDEFAKEYFVIPINLREAKSSGYPPADHSVRDWLTATVSRNEAYDHACSFLEALFICTTDALRSLVSSASEPVEYAGQLKD